jgi:signal transduction histidine kinase
MEDEIDFLKKENERLKVSLKIAEEKLLKSEEKYQTIRQDLLKEIEADRNEIYDLSLKIKEEQTKVSTWEKIVDEMAHSIFTDVYIALTNLEKHKDLPRILKSFYHIKQIRDITNLLMWMIKKDELKLSGKLTTLNISEIVNTQINTIKEGISTLRLSDDTHQENLLKSEIPVNGDNNANVEINEEISQSIELILKDLLRNAMKNTDEANPVVSVLIKSDNSHVLVEIKNNQAIKDEFSDWFNNKSANEPGAISKSSKVGLRIIKEWTKLLKIDAELIPNKTENYTISKIKIPRLIKYE